PRQNRCDRLTHTPLVADVATETLGLTARLRNLRLYRIELLLPPPDQRDARAEMAQFMRRAPPDAAATARDDRHATLEQSRAKCRVVLAKTCGHSTLSSFKAPGRNDRSSRPGCQLTKAQLYVTASG